MLTAMWSAQLIWLHDGGLTRYFCGPDAKRSDKQ